MSPSIDQRDNANFIVAPPGLWITLKIILKPNLWVGESYISGQWYLKKGALADFIEAIQIETNRSFRAYYGFLSGMKGIRFFLRQRLLTKLYTRKVRDHYEVDPRIYELFLDDEMLYTCAFFLSERDGLHEAQQNKISAVIERLSLPSGPCKVLDIGCGWGALPRAIVRTHSTASVCALTISDSQIAWARKRDSNSLQAGGASRIEYRNEDYVDHRSYGCYDAISVVGMIEHVGLSGYNDFFQRIRSFLRVNGRAVIHTIVSPRPTHPTNAWIDRHIFTGGHAPSISEIARAAEHASLRITGIHVYAPLHYRRTIECWLTNFQSNEFAIKEYLQTKGHNEIEIERLTRTWIFYLSGVRSMFSENRESSRQVAQICLCRLDNLEVSKQETGR